MAHSPLNREGQLTEVEEKRRSFIDFRLQAGPIDRTDPATELATTNGCFVQDLIELAIEAIDDFEDERPNLTCRENSIAKTKLEEAWLALDLRRQTRLRAGVLGTYEPHGKPSATANGRPPLTPGEMVTRRHSDDSSAKPTSA